MKYSLITLSNKSILILIVRSRIFLAYVTRIIGRIKILGLCSFAKLYSFALIEPIVKPITNSSRLYCGISLLLTRFFSK